MLTKLLLAPLLAASILSAVEVPRKAQEFVINLPQGGQKLLTEYRGKVVCVEFLFTTCPHCQHSAQLLTTMQKEYGPKGLQVIGVAFNPMAKMLVPDFVKSYNVGFLVGYSDPEPVKNFLQIPVSEAMHVPNLVFIDRNGTIRKQSLTRDDSSTHMEPNVRKMIEELLAEKSSAPSKAKAKPASKKAS